MGLVVTSQAIDTSTPSGRFLFATLAPARSETCLAGIPASSASVMKVCRVQWNGRDASDVQVPFVQEQHSGRQFPRELGSDDEWLHGRRLVRFSGLGHDDRLGVAGVEVAPPEGAVLTQVPAVQGELLVEEESQEESQV